MLNAEEQAFQKEIEPTFHLLPFGKALVPAHSLEGKAVAIFKCTPQLPATGEDRTGAIFSCPMELRSTEEVMDGCLWQGAALDGGVKVHGGRAVMVCFILCSCVLFHPGWQHRLHLEAVNEQSVSWMCRAASSPGFLAHILLPNRGFDMRVMC